MPEERAEVRLAVVVAGEAEPQGRPGHPAPGWDRSTVDLRRVERAEVRGVITVALQKDHPQGEPAEQAERDRDGCRVQPVGQNAVGIGERRAVSSDGRVERHWRLLSN